MEWLGLRVINLETGANIFSFQVVDRLSANIFHRRSGIDRAHGIGFGKMM